MELPNLGRKASTSKTGSQWAEIHNSTCKKIQRHLELLGRDWVLPILSSDEAEAIVRYKDASIKIFKENEVLRKRLENPDSNLF